MRKKHGPVPKIHTCSGLDSHNEQKHWHSKCHYKRNSGSTSAGTNNPTRWGGGGLRSNRRPTGGSPSPALAATTTTPALGGRTAAAMASGRTLLQPCPRLRRRRRPEARMVAVIPSATGTSRAASTSAPTTGAVSPPADPYSDPPGRVGHRPPRGGAVPVQRQDRPRTRTPPWQRATSWVVLPCARRDNRLRGRRGHQEPSRQVQRAEADDARSRPAPRCRSPPLSQGQ
jgi:hypothetical protein